MKIKPANFYLRATMVCPDCEGRFDVRINLDKEVYHECNEGNVKTIVPTLKMPGQVDPITQKLLNRLNGGRK
jgi:hypothetical protein